MNSPFVNKVAESGILTINLEEFYPADEIAVFDMKDYLFMGLILKEKDFREALKNLDIEKFREKYIALTCSADAVIPMWAYMLVSSLLQPVSKDIIYGSEDQAVQSLMLKRISEINPEEYNDKRIVIKGCGELPVAESAYIEITKKLRPVAKSIMYGEPCSTVPVFKKSMAKT
jgi:hypothetical protein